MEASFNWGSFVLRYIATAEPLKFEHVHSMSRDASIGFRPVLERPAFELSTWTKEVVLEDQKYLLRYVTKQRSEGFRPALFCEGLTNRLPYLKQFRAYTLLMNEKPVRQDRDNPVFYKKGAKLSLTDRFFGQEYLIPWIAEKGMLVAQRNVLKGVDTKNLPL